MYENEVIKPMKLFKEWEEGLESNGVNLIKAHYVPMCVWKYHSEILLCKIDVC
jgi:hypothetical protein